MTSGTGSASIGSAALHSRAGRVRIANVVKQDPVMTKVSRYVCPNRAAVAGGICIAAGLCVSIASSQG